MRRFWPTVLLALLLTGSAATVRAEGFRVVTHPEVDGSTLSRATLAAIYQKKVVRWGDRTRIQPVDQSGHSPVRLAFTQQVLGQSLGEIQLFWRDRLARDRVMPPPIKASDEEVLAFVASNDGAIGYVSDGVDLPPTVKLVTIVN